jgi:hypothetical protein
MEAGAVLRAVDGVYADVEDAVERCGRATAAGRPP